MMDQFLLLLKPILKLKCSYRNQSEGKKESKVDKAIPSD